MLNRTNAVVLVLFLSLGVVVTEPLAKVPISADKDLEQTDVDLSHHTGEVAEGGKKLQSKGDANSAQINLKLLEEAADRTEKVADVSEDPSAQPEKPPEGLEESPVPAVIDKMADETQSEDDFDVSSLPARVESPVSTDGDVLPTTSATQPASVTEADSGADTNLTSNSTSRPTADVPPGEHDTAGGAAPQKEGVTTTEDKIPGAPGEASMSVESEALGEAKPSGGDAVPEPTPTEPTPTEVPPTEATPTEATPTEVPPTEATPTEPTPTEVPPTEATPTEATPTEPTPTEVPPTEPTPTEVPPTEPTPTEVPPTEPTPTEPTPTEPTPTEVPPTGETTPESPELTPSEPQGPTGVDLSAHDMPNFADWRKEFLENGKEVKAAHGKVYQAHPATEKMVMGLSTLPPEKLRNFASSECGAKVISSTKEAKNQLFVLNENKDEYMMQPCSARKWVVIELCDPVLLRRIDIGNLELFSSTFENFTVYISKTTDGVGKERAGKDWHSIGSFQALEERVIQSVNMTRLDLFTSYVKIEITSHFGNEHYCPITIIRVYGRGVDDDDDTDDDDDIHESTGSEPASQSEPTPDSEEPCTQAPPTDFTDTPPDSGDGGPRPAMKGVIFPPQPHQCFLCYDSLDLVPNYCWPEYYELRESLNTSSKCNKTGKGNAALPVTVSQSHDTGQQTEVKTEHVESPAENGADSLDLKPCEPDSAPPSYIEALAERPAAVADVDKVGTDAQSNQSANKTLVNNHTSKGSESGQTTSPQAKVKPSPIVVDGDAPGNELVLISSTTNTPVPSSTVPSSTETETVSQSADSDQTDDMDSTDPELILPSPPTLAEPPTEVPDLAPVDTTPAPVTTAVAEEEPSQEEETEPEDMGTPADPPPPASRLGNKRTIISKLSNQVKSLEHSQRVTNSYLDEMSKKYKNQKEDLQRALNYTMKSLQNTTMKLDLLRKEYNSLQETTERLSEQLIQLQEHLQFNQSAPWLTPSISIGALLLAILISSCRRAPNEAINREEIERILENMPDSPVRRGHKRSGSTSETANQKIMSPSGAAEPPDARLMKKAKSYAAFKSISGGDVAAAAGPSTGEMVGTREYKVPTSAQRAPSNTPDIRSTPTSTPPQTPTHDDIEIVCPATWRSFDTPDGKSLVLKAKKKRRSNKVKSSKNILNGPITEQVTTDLQHDDQSAQSSQGQRLASSRQQRPKSAASAVSERRYQNGSCISSHAGANNSTASPQKHDSAVDSSWIPALFRRRSAT